MQKQALNDIDVVTHCTSYTGSGPTVQVDLNTRATHSLVNESMGKVQRFVYLSTAGVYGMDPHRLVRAGRGAVKPASTLSASRLNAEQSVRDAGGQVVRPNLVFGAGDKWAIPGIARAIEALGIPAAPSPQISIILVEQLADLIATIALTAPWVSSHVSHGCPPKPISAAALTGTAPIPAASVKITRHRLSRGGDGSANAAVHRIVLVRMATDRRTQDYVAKRTAQGKGKLEIMRSKAT